MRFRGSESSASVHRGIAGGAADTSDNQTALRRARTLEPKGHGRDSGVVSEAERHAYFAELGPAPEAMVEEQVKKSEGPHGWGWRQLVLRPEPEPEPELL